VDNRWEAYSIWLCDKSCVDQCTARLKRPVALCRKELALPSFVGWEESARSSWEYAHARSASKSNSSKLSTFVDLSYDRDCSRIRELTVRLVRSPAELQAIS
jgi:hypothetical protein